MADVQSPEELKARQDAVIAEIRERADDAVPKNAYDLTVEELETIRDTLPEKPDPESPEAQARKEAQADATGDQPVDRKPEGLKGKATHVVGSQAVLPPNRAIILPGTQINAAYVGGKEILDDFVARGLVNKGL